MLCGSWDQSYSDDANEGLFFGQLLEDVEETMNCAVFEEASLSRKLNSEYGTVCGMNLCNLYKLLTCAHSFRSQRLLLAEPEFWGSEEAVSEHTG